MGEFKAMVGPGFHLFGECLHTFASVYQLISHFTNRLLEHNFLSCYWAASCWIESTAGRQRNTPSIVASRRQYLHYRDLRSLAREYDHVAVSGMTEEEVEEGTGPSRGNREDAMYQRT
jgi:hypothetical protein